MFAPRALRPTRAGDVRQPADVAVRTETAPAGSGSRSGPRRDIRPASCRRRSGASGRRGPRAAARGSAVKWPIASREPEGRRWTASAASGKMQLDSLQQATQFSVSPRRRAATPRRASMLARSSAGQSGSMAWASAKRRSASANSPTDMWRSPRKMPSLHRLRSAGRGPDDRRRPGPALMPIDPALAPPLVGRPDLFERLRVRDRSREPQGQSLAAVVGPVLGSRAGSGAEPRGPPATLPGLVVPRTPMTGAGTARGLADRAGSVKCHTAPADAPTIPTYEEDDESPASPAVARWWAIFVDLTSWIRSRSDLSQIPSNRLSHVSLGSASTRRGRLRIYRRPIDLAIGPPTSAGTAENRRLGERQGRFRSHTTACTRKANICTTYS